MAVIFGSLVMGAIIGLIPYFEGKSLGMKKAGNICWGICILANFLSGLLLSIPVCIVCIIVLLVKAK